MERTFKIDVDAIRNRYRIKKVLSEKDLPDGIVVDFDELNARKYKAYIIEDNFGNFRNGVFYDKTPEEDDNIFETMRDHIELLIDADILAIIKDTERAYTADKVVIG